MDTCAKCKRPMTFAEQRRQYARLRKANYSNQQAKAMLPRCQKCLTILVMELKKGLADFIDAKVTMQNVSCHPHVMTYEEASNGQSRN